MPKITQQSTAKKNKATLELPYASRTIQAPGNGSPERRKALTDISHTRNTPTKPSTKNSSFPTVPSNAIHALSVSNSNSRPKRDAQRKSAKLDFRDEIEYFKPPLEPPVHVSQFQTLNSSIDSVSLPRPSLKANSLKKKGVAYPLPPPVVYEPLMLSAPKPVVQLKSVVQPKRPLLLKKSETPLDISKVLSSSAAKRPSNSREEREMDRIMVEHEFSADTPKFVTSSIPSRKRKAFVFDTDSDDDIQGPPPPFDDDNDLEVNSNIFSDYDSESETSSIASSLDEVDDDDDVSDCDVQPAFNRKVKKLAVSNVVNTFSPVPLPLKSTTSFHVPPSTTLPYRNQNLPTAVLHITSKSGHIKGQDFVDLKDRIKSMVYCFNDIKKIAPEDVAAIFRLREWPVLSMEQNLAKVMRFCVLEFLPECETPLNHENSNLVNFLLLKRLHRRILATNENSGRSGPLNYEGLARFACEFRYIQGARMVCSMASVASSENILDVIKQTEGVGKELYSHILEFLSSESVFIFPKQITTESMTAIASAVAAGISDDKKLFIGKRKNSTFENDSDFEVEAGPSNPKTKKSKQAGQTSHKKSSLSLVDGVFSIDGVAQKEKIDQETCGILSNIDWSKTDLQNHGNHCYPASRKVPIHKIVAANLKDENTEHWTKLGWTILQGGKLIIGHLDDNCYNFNKSNLMWIPTKLNSWSRKEIVYGHVGKGFTTTLRVGKFINTDSYADKDMVLHEKNILKMIAVPLWARSYMLKYGLLIPSKFSSFYSDVSTLLACATVRQKAKVSNKVKKQQTKTSVEIVAYKDLTEVEKEIHDHEMKVSGVDLDDDECIARYIGIKITALWWMSILDFEHIFKNFNGELQINDGYVNYLGQNLHLIVLGRSKGQGDHDGLVGRHYRDVKMDNRKRTLLMGSHSDNQMDKKESNLPMGVGLLPSGNYQAKINFYLNLTELFSVGLGTYKDFETASKAFQSVYVQKAMITAELEKMDPTDQNARIKHAKNYISLI